KIHQKYQGETRPVLEINPGHSLIKKMAAMAEGGTTGEDMKDAAFLLLDQARIIQGQPLKNPAAFTRRMTAFMERGLS
ncbi:MAG TPA: molecular chaperone HtpG, partial [Rhodospirillaceae bacterium]|nr:molecular chaperone HtpG [Rhodospirillaceae bacterium]